MKIETVETRHCNAGWRNYHFVRIETVNGIVGWSEYDDGFRPAGVTTAIEQFGHLVVGHDVRNHEAIYARLTAAARQSLVGVLPRAIGAIENAVLAVLRVIVAQGHSHEANVEVADPSVPADKLPFLRHEERGRLAVDRRTRDLQVAPRPTDVLRPRPVEGVRRGSVVLDDGQQTPVG